MHIFIIEESEKWIEDYIMRKTGGGRKRVEDAEAAIRQEQEDKEAAENAGLLTGEPGKMFHEMMIAIEDTLSDVACSDNGEDGEDKDCEDTEHG